MNRNRILLGGIAAGVAMNILDFVIHGVILMDRYRICSEAGLLLKDPRFPFMAVWPIVLLVIGVVIAWLYAAARPRLGPGPRTALLVGLAVGFLWGLPSNLGTAAWGTFGRYIPFVWCVGAFVQAIAGALVAGALYREGEAAAPAVAGGAGAPAGS